MYVWWVSPSAEDEEGQYIPDIYIYICFISPSLLSSSNSSSTIYKQNTVLHSGNHIYRVSNIHAPSPIIWMLYTVLCIFGRLTGVAGVYAYSLIANCTHHTSMYYKTCIASANTHIYIHADDVRRTYNKLPRIFTRKICYKMSTQSITTTSRKYVIEEDETKNHNYVIWQNEGWSNESYLINFSTHQDWQKTI